MTDETRPPGVKAGRRRDRQLVDRDQGAADQAFFEDLANRGLGSDGRAK